MRIMTDFETRSRMPMRVSNPMDAAEGLRPYYTAVTGRRVCPRVTDLPIQELPMTATQVQLQSDYYSEAQRVYNREVEWNGLVERHTQMMDALFQQSRIKLYGQKKANEEGQYELCL